MAYTVVTGHPRVDIRPSDISIIAGRATGAHSSTYDELKTWCDDHISDSLSMGSSSLGEHMEAYAFVYLVEKELLHSGYTDYSDRAKLLMAEMPSSLGGTGYPKIALARAFDWIYPELTASEKTPLITTMSALADQCIAYEYTSGTHSVNMACAPLVHLGLALYDDDLSKANESLDRAHWWFIDTSNVYRVVDNWNETAGDGASFAGDYSYHIALRNPAEWLHAWDKGTDGEDQTQRFDHLENTGLFYAHVAIPNFPNQPLGDGTLRYTYKDTGFGLYICSTIYSDGRASWAASQSSTWIVPEKWRYIVWDDPNISPVTPDDLDKVYFFDSLGAVYMRSGWDLTGSSTDIISNFRCSKRADWHTHCDQLSFEIRRGPSYLATDSGFGSTIKGLNPPGEHFIDYYIRTVAHNSLLIFDATETFPMASYGDRKNDGGQQWTNRDGPYPITSRLPGGVNARGFIDKHIDTTDYTYSYGDATSSYSSTGNDQGVNTKVDNVTRQYIYLKSQLATGHYFVVFDRISATDSSYEKRWLLHSIGTPAIEDGGSWDGGTALNAGGGTPGQTSSDTDIVSVTEGNSKLFVNTVFPLNHSVKRVGGPDANGSYNNADSFEFYHNGGNNYDPSNSHNFGKWRIEVSPSGVDVLEDNIFLHVLEPAASGWSATPVSGLSDTTNSYYGAQIQRPNEPWVVMCSEAESLGTDVTYTLTTAAKRHLICDLAAGNYYVKRDGVSVSGSPFTATSANTIYFEDAGTGVYTISTAPGPTDTTPPTGTILIAAQDGDLNQTTSVNVNLTLSATDTESGMGSGAEMQFSNDNVTYSTAEAYGTSKAWVLDSIAAGTQEIKTVYVKYKDVSGNWSSPFTDTILLINPPDPDITPPTGTITINGNATVTTTVSVTLTLSATDDDSGVSQMQFSNDNDNWSAPESYSTSKLWTLPTIPEGTQETKTVYAKFKDAADNWSAVYSDDILLDIPEEEEPADEDDDDVSEDWVTTTAGNTTWTEHKIVVPVAGHQPAVGGDEWDELWTGGYDFTPWARAGDKSTTWTEG